MNPCRCGHKATWHVHPHVGYPACLLCRCPEYRAAEPCYSLTTAGAR